MLPGYAKKRENLNKMLFNITSTQLVELSYKKITFKTSFG